MAREFLRITPEATWGTYDSGGTHTIIQLDQNNAFTMRPKPVFFTIRSAITLVVIVGTVVVYTAGGSLSFTALGGFALLLVVHRRHALPRATSVR